MFGAPMKHSTKIVVGEDAVLDKDRDFGGSLPESIDRRDFISLRLAIQPAASARWREKGSSKNYFHCCQEMELLYKFLVSQKLIRCG
jgi:hypothetical protein